MTTMQQHITNRISNISDEGLAVIDQFINSLNPAFFSSKPTDNTSTLKRFGIAKEYMDECDSFDAHNDEIADLFEEQNQ